MAFKDDAFDVAIQAHSFPNSTGHGPIFFAGKVKEDAFFCLSVLISVTLPNTTTTIGKNAFGNCTYLAYIPLPYAVTEIGESAFSGCIHMDTVTVDGTAVP